MMPAAYLQRCVLQHCALGITRPFKLLSFHIAPIRTTGFACSAKHVSLRTGAKQPFRTSCCDIPGERGAL